MSLTLTIITSMTVVFSAASVVYLFSVWIRRRRFTKERFAFVVLNSWLQIAVSLISFGTSSSTPWHLIGKLIEAITQISIDAPERGFVDYPFLIMVYALFVYGTNTLFKNWDGKRSVAQYEAEQRKQDMSVFMEGIAELSRIVQRKDPLAIHKLQSYRPTLQLVAPVASIAWRDRARELIQLRWSYYAFPAETGWHDNERCWVGKNVNTTDLVLLRCSARALTAAELDSFVAYTKRLMPNYATSSADLIVAVEGGCSGSTGVERLPDTNGNRRDAS